MPEELRVQFEKFISEIKKYGKGHEGHAHEAYVQGALAHVATAQSFMDSHFAGIVQERDMAVRDQAIAQIQATSEEQIRAHNEELMANRERSEQFHADLAARSEG